MEYSMSDTYHLKTYLDMSSDLKRPPPASEAVRPLEGRASSASAISENDGIW